MTEEIQPRGVRSKLRIWAVSTYAAVYLTGMAYTYASGETPSKEYIMYGALPLFLPVARGMVRRAYAAFDDWAYERRAARNNPGSASNKPVAGPGIGPYDPLGGVSPADHVGQ